MHSHSNERAPVGVVPRSRAQTIEPLMSDAPDACTVTEAEASPASGRKFPLLPQWMSAMASLGLIAAALEWMKFPR